MRLFRHFDSIPPECRGAILALGNFDGVHFGHQAVLGRAMEKARQKNLPMGVLTFEPHPREFFMPDAPPFRLTPFHIKMRLFQAMGLDFVCCLAFDANLAAMSAEEFATKILKEGLSIAGIVVGEDFHFGKNRSGNAKRLQEFGKELGFSVEPVAPRRAENGVIYSSTAIREELLAGKPEEVISLLGRPWEIAGRVEHGNAQGAKLGFPTANLSLHGYLRPKLGVYAIFAAIEEEGYPQWLEGVANIGRRPTFGGEKVQLEAHLFGFSEDLYSKHLRVALVGFIRPEMKFDSLDALKDRIAKDCDKAKAILKAYKEEMLEIDKIDPSRPSNFLKSFS